MDNQPVIDYNPTEATPEDIAQLILDLRKERDEGIIDERVLDFLQNLEDSVNTAGPVGDDQLDAVAGGFGGKRLGALAAAATMLLSGLGGSPMAASRETSLQIYDKIVALNDEYANNKIPKDEYDKRKEALEYQFKQTTKREELEKDQRMQTIGMVIGGVGGGLLLGSMIIKNTAEILSYIKSGYMHVSNSIRNFYLRHTSKPIDIKIYETVLGRIESRLKKELVGQDEAIKQMINSMRGYFESVIQTQARGKKFEGGMILYLTGLPGTGKSTAMKIIGEEMGLKPYIGRMSNAIEDKGNNANTVAARLTKPVIVDDGHTKSQQDTELMRQVKIGIPTLYCLDEIDKMRNLDRVLQKHDGKTSDGKLMGESVDEMLRNFGDTGQINGVNASGSILIATSNETPEQLAQLESSLYNRYKSCHVHFKSFNKQDYKEMIRRDTKATLSYYRQKYKVDVIFDDSLMEKYPEKLVKEEGSGRGVNSLTIRLRAALKNYVNQNKDYKNSKVSLGYNSNNDEIIVKKI